MHLASRLSEHKSLCALAGSGDFPRRGLGLSAAVNAAGAYAVLASAASG